MGISPTAVTAAFVAPLGAANRAELASGLAFLNGSATPAWGVRGLRDWFAEHLVERGYMDAPRVVTEPSGGTISLNVDGRDAPGAASSLSKVLAAARIRTVSALRGLIATPTDDRFLSAAIFSGRVRRRRVNGENLWVAQPDATTPLSGVVLALFAVDVLSHREEYDERLCVCDVCSRITFQQGALRRKSCPDHLPQVSGVSRRVTPPAGKPDE